MLDRALRAVQIEAFWPVWADAARQVRVTCPAAAYGGVSGGVQDSHVDLRTGTGQTVRSLSVSTLTDRRDIACDITLPSRCG
jgi:hypothetical protein